MRLLASPIASVLFLLITRAASAGDPARFALLVGSNVGDANEPILRHAEDDAARLAQTLRTLGDFPPDQVQLMTGVTASELRDALIRINARVREHRQAVLLVYYSGHADTDALHLSGTRLANAELKALLVGSPAASRVLIVDACRSGALIQLKGARSAVPFPVPIFAAPVPEGFAVLTSSAATEDSQESMALRSSFFTYYLNSGLIGAADQDHDGAVTLSELYAYASSETRSATASTQAGPQSPTFQFALGGRHDLVLTHPGRRDVRLGALRFSQAGRYLVQRWEIAGLSPPLAELAARESGAELALPPGRYRVTLRSERDVSERDCQVVGGETTVVEASQMIRVDIGRIVRKGGPRKSATGFALVGGWHSEIGDSSLDLGAGPSLMMVARHDRRWFSFESRFWLDHASLTDARGVHFENRELSASVSWLFPVDWRTLTVAAGLDVGVVFLHQKFTATMEHAGRVALPVTPSLLEPRWSSGIRGGPLLQIDIPVGPWAYLRFETGASIRVFRGSPQSNPASSMLDKGTRTYFVGGAGAAF